MRMRGTADIDGRADPVCQRVEKWRRLRARPGLTSDRKCKPCAGAMEGDATDGIEPPTCGV